MTAPHFYASGYEKVLLKARRADDVTEHGLRRRLPELSSNFDPLAKATTSEPVGSAAPCVARAHRT